MHVTIRKYSGVADVKEMNRIVVTDVVPAMRAWPGFRSYTIVQTGADSCLSIGVFDSAEAAEGANARARDIVARSALRTLLPNAPEVTVGEILSDAR